ncbi:MAG TPA: DUF2723 domain-containing protein [Thermoanaerobaculia bacterium]|nr:DUF2723 domain-containing protein [Thermoanaerobaculia bacterium]
MALAFVLPLLLYTTTAAPTVYNLDSAELTTAAYTGGLVRATGYPTYLLVGRLWSHLPILGEDVGRRMNLLSAVCGAATLALCAGALARLGVGFWAGLGALGLLATSRYFWALSLIAEVYTLHTLFVAAILIALLCWRADPSPVRLGTAALLVGLSFGNHLSTLFLVPGCAAYALLARPDRALARRTLATVTLALLIGAAVYLYLPWRSLRQPTFNYVGTVDAEARFEPIDLTRPANMLWLVGGHAFVPLMLDYRIGDYLREVARLGTEIWRAFAGVGFVPAVLGLFVLGRRDRPFAVATVLVFVGHAAFFVGYRTADKDTMFLPCYLVWAIWLAIGLQWLIESIVGRRPVSSASRFSAGLFAAFLAAVVAGQAAWNFPLVDQSRDDSARRLGEIVLARMEPGAMLVGGWGTVPVVQYLQLVEGRRPDVQAVNSLIVVPGELGALLRRQAARRAVYVDLPADADVLGVRFERGWPVRRARLELRQRPERAPERRARLTSPAGDG